ncbi:hypothetical protein F7P73_02995 [Acinetobacter bohemicus]|uniref:Uncharacterized protein n=1 Tax=Acinetobacter bohemicus TaxID=1435036 RepID=A0A1I6UHU5_9GAMM|nr:hypothetical protein [Acinetobacter bohemicus]KAB0654310.1 hypothetical protein F7P73_02995 [Acinetobacter bohemicus]SFT01015.1 hypothetical protein SAMN05444586_101640 [Acinetobacter bohemicus]
MHAKLLSLSLITGLMSATAFAEPAIQAGDSLDSLSKVKVSTTVNGQAGSIQDLVASGQIRIVDANQTPAAPAQVGTEAAIQNHSTVNATTGQMGSPAVEQANAPAIEQTAQVASENVEAMQPNAELAAQQTEQALNQKATAPMISSSAETPVNAADRAQIDVTQDAVAAAPVNAADTMTTNDAVAAIPEVAQPHDAIQAAPQADLSDAPVNASPEAPIAETTEN